MKYTEKQVEEFFIKKLKFLEWKSVLKDDKAGFLTKVMRQYMVNIFYHNFTITAKDSSVRDTPTLDEIMKAGIAGSGGVCFEMNYFLKLLLVSAGLDAYTIKGSFAGPGAIPDSHCMVVVRVSEHEKYLLDVASLHPMEEAVPLHALPYKARAAGFGFDYRYNFNNDGLYTRHQIGGSFLNGPFADGQPTEQLRFYFTLEPVEYFEFVPIMRPIYTDSHFVKIPFLFRYTKFTDTEYEFIIIMNSDVLIAGRETRRVERLGHFDALLPFIAEYFPGLDETTKAKAFDTFNADRSTDSPPPPV